MSDQNSLFGSNNNAQETPASAPASNAGNPSSNEEIGNLLSQIKNERGEQKYRSLEDALNALKHSQEFIPQLTAKVKTYEGELEQARQVAARVQEVEETIRKLTQAPAAQQQPTVAPGLKPEDVAELVNSTLSQREIERQRENNVSVVVNSVRERFGNDADSVFYGKAKELGIAPEAFNKMAAESPKVVLSLLGIADTAVRPTSKQSVTNTALNTSAIQPNQQSYLGKNTSGVLVGATTQQVIEESRRSAAMVEELHAQGKTVHDLTDPRVYFKHFG